MITSPPFLGFHDHFADGHTRRAVIFGAGHGTTYPGKDSGGYTPGGLTYTQVIDLIAGLGKRARIAGFDLVELYPPADIDGLSALTAARVLVNAIGTIVWQA